ncbi:MAG TPA: hypothetical protein VFG07_02865 [Thermoplasmata archaeon]|nr:hypothetical protein [Thermoplasmata archaeon]
MLIETTFRIGGLLLVGLGIALAAAFALLGAATADPGLFLPASLFFVLGGLFLYVGHDAARERRALLALGDPRPGTPADSPKDEAS